MKKPAMNMKKFLKASNPQTDYRKPNQNKVTGARRTKTKNVKVPALKKNAGTVYFR